MSEATLELCRATLRSAGSALTQPLSLRSEARQIGLVGNWEALFQALTGQAQIASGSARVLGCDWERALADGVLGFAAHDPPLPQSFTVTRYLEHAARLTHGSRSRASAEARRALDRYGLRALAARPLSRLALYERRAVGIALATLTAPPVACLENPLGNLDAPSAEYVARLCAEAALHGRLIVSAVRPSGASPERALLDTCEELFVLEQGALKQHGSPAAVFAPSQRYSLTVSGGNWSAFSHALRDAGVEFDALDPQRPFSVQLPSATNSDLLLDAALEHGLAVLELEPS